MSSGTSLDRGPQRQSKLYVLENIDGTALPGCVCRKQKNNSELVKAVKAVNDKENKYIIVFDNSFDNLQVYKERRRLMQYAEGKSNILILEIICFEYILLEFDKLIDWIYAPDDEFLTKRADAIRARKSLVKTIRSGDLNYKTLREIVEYDGKLKYHNIEQLAARLLYDLTRNTGFEVSKGKLGDCWTKSCCDWKDRQEHDICGLDIERLPLSDKMRSIFYGISLHNELTRAGLEVSD